MKLNQTITDAILGSQSKALATHGPLGVHVTPVSTIRVQNNQILLVNYFMRRTLENLLENPDISLACWKGLEGIRIKGTATYVTAGEEVEEISAWAREHVSDRTVHGVIVIEPHELHDVSATAKVPGSKIT